MNSIGKNYKLIWGFLIICCTVYAQNPPANNSIANAVFTIDNINYDYGNIPEDGGLASHTFFVKNTSDAPLVIRQVDASCGCTTPTWTKDPIIPGNSGEIFVAYDPNGRPGPFEKTITVRTNNADPVELSIKGIVDKKNDDAPKKPTLSLTEVMYDFGTIGENDGFAEHIFNFKNTGDAPLRISRITTTCGCTQPEWTTDPVQPGGEGIIIITFNPKGRLGNFNKTATVYTNEENGVTRHKLTLLGNVIEKPMENPFIVYTDTIGGIGIERTNLMYRPLSSTAPNFEVMNIKNYNTKTAYLSWENVPEHISIKSPDSLKADWPGEIHVTIDKTKTIEKRGRITDILKWTIKDYDGNILGSDFITATVNYLDDFSKLSPLQSVSAPSLEIKNPIIDFGETKSGFLGMGGSSSKQFTLTNKGKSDLILHSVTGEDSRVYLPDLKGKTIKAGESLAVNVTVKVKELETENINTDIYVVCNDPKAPVRRLNVIAQKP